MPRMKSNRKWVAQEQPGERERQHLGPKTWTESKQVAKDRVERSGKEHCSLMGHEAQGGVVR